MENADKRLVEQVQKYSFIYFSLCYFYYFSTGYFWLFYKKIEAFLSNEHRERTYQTI